MHVLTIVGARPQFIKAAALSLAIREDGRIEETLLHTGQHYDPALSEVFFDELKIPQPDYMLNVGSASHGTQTGKMLTEIEKVLLQNRPDAVLVYGDTNSTLAGALAAAKLHIPVAHVEAGLRSYNRKMPEEINRVLTDQLSDWLFVPTEGAVQNLLKEGYERDLISVVGDIMYDSTLRFTELAAEKSSILSKLNLAPEAYALATIHRAENTDDPARLQTILQALDAFVDASGKTVIWPAHPRTTGKMSELGLKPIRVQVTPPLGYLDMLTLERQAVLMITDSGGVQKEAYFHQRPCVTLRDETEWTELVELGWNELCSPQLGPEAMAKILAAAQGRRGRDGGTPYGNGDTGKRIVDGLLNR